MLKKTSWCAIRHSPRCETLVGLFTQFPVSVEVNDGFANTRWEQFICPVKPYARLPWPWPPGGSEGMLLLLASMQCFDQTRWQRAHSLSILSSSLPQTQLTLHQLARPWSLRERCWGGERETESQPGPKGSSTTGVRESGMNRRTKAE